MSNKTIIIVGAGVMGVSTALVAKRESPHDIVYLIDDIHTSIEPASKDTAKIIRAAYNSEPYARLAAEAMELWRAEPIYAKFWHQSGWILLHPAGQTLSISRGPGSMSKGRFRETFKDTDLDCIHDMSEDGDVAWVDASKALEATINLAIADGVIFNTGKVVDLLWDGSICRGVGLGDGTEIPADEVLLAMGPQTPTFLAQQEIPLEEGLCQTAGVTVLAVQLNDQQYEKYKEMPILNVPGVGEILPPNKDKILKVNNARSFGVSDPTLIEAEYPLTLDSPYLKETLAFLSWLLPDLRKAPVVSCRYCLDCITRSQDFCIRPVQGRKGLYVAFGGSFHGWKFLTNIGHYVVKMMNGDESFFKEWKRWVEHDGSSGEFIHGEIIPKRKLSETRFPEARLAV